MKRCRQRGKSLTDFGLKERLVPDASVYSETPPSYNGLDASGFQQLRIHHSKLWADGKNHIRATGTNFNGIPKAHLPPRLKEGKWRFNHPKTN
jgi:transposase-like protein